MTKKKLADADNDDLIRQLKDDISKHLHLTIASISILEALNAGFPEIVTPNNPQPSSTGRMNRNRRGISSHTAPPTFDPSIVSLTVPNSRRGSGSPKSEESRSLLEGSMEFTVWT